MRFTIAFLLLPALASAFAPAKPFSQPLTRLTESAALLPEPEALNDLTSKISDKVEQVMEKTDDLFMKNVMRFVNHAPAIATLGSLLNQLGSTRYGLDIAPSALKFATPAGFGAVPAWVGYSLPVLVLTQAAAIVRSSLTKSDDEELSQEDISALAVSNFALARALSAPTTVNWAIAAVASGFYARKNTDVSDNPKLSNLSVQITSSLASVATILGVAAQLPQVVPFLQGQEQLTGVIGLLGFMGYASRDGNGIVKKVVNACVIGGVLVSKIASGALSMSNLMRMDTIVTAMTMYVAAVTLDKARVALFD